MGRSGCFEPDKSAEECAFSHCLSKFRDEHGNRSTITTTPSPIETTEPIAPPASPDKSGLSYDGNFPVYIGLGSGLFVVLCITCILCLCRSRNKERQKRRIIEEDYRVVATTLTNVNDSDGTTYEELCIDNPHYNRHHDVQLPCKKDRKRLPGVSTALTDTVKRWVSVDGNQATANTSKTLMQATNKPLPPIPDPNRQNSVPYSKEAASTKLSQSIDEYTEIGSEVKRRSNVYNPLDMDKIGHVRDSHGTYESLRASKMLENTRPPMGLPAGEYFTLEKDDDEVRETEHPAGEYMILAKEEEEETCLEHDRLLQKQEAPVNEKEEAQMEIHDRLIQKQKAPVNGQEQPHVEPYAESARCLIEDEADSGICESGGNKNEYYILEKTSDENGEDVDGSDYIEPAKGERHSYMQVLPEHSATCPN